MARVTAAAFRSIVARANGGVKPSKYRNKKTIGFDKDGTVVKLDSKREAKRWAQLQLMERRGEIIELQRQVSYTFRLPGEPDRFLMGPPSKKTGRRTKHRYVADFVYREVANPETWVVEDVKGVRTDRYRCNWGLMDLFYNIQIRET
jgi:hypothetical protein